MIRDVDVLKSVLLDSRAATCSEPNPQRKVEEALLNRRAAACEGVVAGAADADVVAAAADDRVVAAAAEDAVVARLAVDRVVSGASEDQVVRGRSAEYSVADDEVRQRHPGAGRRLDVVRPDRPRDQPRVRRRHRVAGGERRARADETDRGECAHGETGDLPRGHRSSSRVRVAAVAVSSRASASLNASTSVAFVSPKWLYRYRAPPHSTRYEWVPLRSSWRIGRSTASARRARSSIFATSIVFSRTAG